MNIHVYGRALQRAHCRRPLGVGLLPLLASDNVNIALFLCVTLIRKVQSTSVGLSHARDFSISDYRGDSADLYSFIYR